MFRSHSASTLAAQASRAAFNECILCCRHPVAQTSDSCTVKCVPAIAQPFGCRIMRPSVALNDAHKSLSCLQGTDLEQSGSVGGNDVQTPGKRRSADVGADLAGQLSLKRLKINKNNFTGLEQQGCHIMTCCQSAL